MGCHDVSLVARDSQHHHRDELFGVHDSRHVRGIPADPSAILSIQLSVLMKFFSSGKNRRKLALSGFFVFLSEDLTNHKLKGRVLPVLVQCQTDCRPCHSHFIVEVVLAAPMILLIILL